jgi:hypothetical protein
MNWLLLLRELFILAIDLIDYLTSNLVRFLFVFLFTWEIPMATVTTQYSGTDPSQRPIIHPFNYSKRCREAGTEHFQLLMKTPYGRQLVEETSTTQTIPPLLAAMKQMYDQEAIDTLKPTKPKTETVE